jgi:hypothetical protein
VAVAESVLVAYDYAAKRSIPVSDSLVTAIESFEGRILGPMASRGSASDLGERTPDRS